MSQFPISDADLEAQRQMVRDDLTDVWAMQHFIAMDASNSIRDRANAIRVMDDYTGAIESFGLSDEMLVEQYEEDIAIVFDIGADRDYHPENHHEFNVRDQIKHITAGDDDGPASTYLPLGEPGQGSSSYAGGLPEVFEALDSVSESFQRFMDSLISPYDAVMEMKHLHLEDNFDVC